MALASPSQKYIVYGASALNSLFLFEDVFIVSGQLEHICERDDRFVYCDRICYIGIYIPADSGQGLILATQPERKIVLICTGNVVADSDLNTVGSGHFAIIGELVENPDSMV